MTWTLGFGLLLSILPIFVLVAPRIKQRKPLLFWSAICVEAFGITLLVFYVISLFTSPFSASGG